MATGVGQLDSYFTNLISNLMVIERQPLTRLTEQKDALTTQKAVYSDLQSKFTSLQDALNALRSSQATYSLKGGRKISVMPPANATVATATVGSDALSGNYTLEVTRLAKAHTARSAQVNSSDQDLGKTGKIRLGGAAERSQVRQDAVVDTVAEFGTTAVASGQKELGSGTFSVETRYDAASSKWQFRLVDAEGSAVSIRQGASTTSFGAGWQELTASQTYDTGRGLTITFAGDAGQFQARDRLNAGAAKTAYSAQGVELELKADMSLNEIAAEINKLKYADGNEIAASVVDRRLVLQSAKSGEARVMQTADVTGSFFQDIAMLGSASGPFLNATAGQNSLFTINGVSVERSSNTGLTDVLSGVSLNLAGDAEGKTATISVTSDVGGARSAVNAFIQKFNDFQTYVKGKTAVTKGADGTYTRAALAGDYSLKGFASDLYSRFTATATNDGIYKNLRQIGIDLNTDMQATVSDSAKLDDALLNHLPDVQKLMDAAMGGMNTKLSLYTGDKGYANLAKKSTETQIESVDDRITALNARLTAREEQYTNQYAQIQAQLLQMTYLQEQWTSIYSATSSLY